MASRASDRFQEGVRKLDQARYAGMSTDRYRTSLADLTSDALYGLHQARSSDLPEEAFEDRWAGIVSERDRKLGRR